MLCWNAYFLEQASTKLVLQAPQFRVLSKAWDPKSDLFHVRCFVNIFSAIFAHTKNISDVYNVFGFPLCFMMLLLTGSSNVNQNIQTNTHIHIPAFRNAHHPLCIQFGQWCAVNINRQQAPCPMNRYFYSISRKYWRTLRHMFFPQRATSRAA